MISFTRHAFRDGQMSACLGLEVWGDEETVLMSSGLPFGVIEMF